MLAFGLFFLALSFLFSGCTPSAYSIRSSSDCPRSSCCQKSKKISFISDFFRKAYYCLKSTDAPSLSDKKLNRIHRLILQMKAKSVEMCSSKKKMNLLVMHVLFKKSVDSRKIENIIQTHATDLTTYALDMAHIYTEFRSLFTLSEWQNLSLHKKFKVQQS